MDASEQITQFKQFIEREYLPELLENTRQGKRFIIIDFQSLSKFNIELTENLLDNPDEVIKAAQIAIEQIDIPNNYKNNEFHVRFKNLPNSQEIRIRDIRSRHIGQFYSFIGYVRQKTDVRPQVTSSRFECPSCGNVIPVLQLDTKLKEPSRCGCGRKGRFKLLSKELIDAQSMKLEEAIEELDGGEQPKRMNVFLKEDLVHPLTEKKASMGSKIRINGYVKEVPVILRTGGQSTRMDLMIEANYFEPINEEFDDVIITKEDINIFNKLREDPELGSKLLTSVAPSIFGYNELKESLILLLLGGVRKKKKDGKKIRGDIHMFAIGDPGAGKTQILKRVSAIAPKSRFVSGKGVSGVGLTATAVRDEFIGGWALEAGALPLANKGILCIDELDKISPEDTSAMHEALEGQTVTVSKANIQATLRTETTVLAAANPKFGTFDPYSKTIAEQFNIPSTLINRFDLIFAIKDKADENIDKEKSFFVIDEHIEDKSDKAPFNTNFMRKFISYAKKLKPKISKEAKQKLSEYYVMMRKSSSSDGLNKSMPITLRQLEGLVRLSEAYAKKRLSDTVDIKDAEKSIKLMDYCLRQIATDQDTGQLDLSMIEIGEKSTKRNHLFIAKKIINDLHDKIGNTIPIEDIIEQASTQGISEEEIESILERLRRSGDIHEPKRGFIAKI